MSALNQNITLAARPRNLSRFFRFENPLLSYGFAVVTVAIAAILSNSLRPIIKADSFEVFLGAVLLSTYCGRHSGFGPGLLASALSIVALDYYFIPPINSFALEITDFLRIIVFAAIAILIGSLSGRLKKAMSEVQNAHDVLELRVQERTKALLSANIHLKEEVAQRLEAQGAILTISNREQRRLGQDLHDGLIQILAGVRLIVEDLKRKLIAQDHALSGDMIMVESCLNDALTQADTISRGLYPVELENNGLMAALEELAGKISKLYPVACEFVCRKPVLINDPATATHLYRIAQEAVSNAIKGGKAKRIRVRLLEGNERVLLSVADNGIGFKKGRVRNGMGLQIMSYRSRFINGELRFLSRPQGGTVVQCAFSPGLTRGKEE